MFTGNY